MTTRQGEIRIRAGARSLRAAARRLRARVAGHANRGSLLCSCSPEEEQAANARELAAAHVLEVRALKARGATVVLPTTVAREVAKLRLEIMAMGAVGAGDAIWALANACASALGAMPGRPRHKLASIERALSRPDLHDERNLRRLAKRARVERWWRRMHESGASFLTFNEPYPGTDSS